MYARELAEAFASGRTTSSFPPESSHSGLERLDALVELATPMSRALQPIIDGLYADLKQVSSALGELHTVVVGLGRRIGAAHDLLSELDRLANCAVNIALEEVDIGRKLRGIVGQLTSRSDRLGVQIESSADQGASTRTLSTVFGLLLHSLLAQAILATPAGQLVKVCVRSGDDQLLISIEDGGPIVPEPAFAALQKGVGVPQSLGRPAGLGWLIAGACAKKLGTRLELGTSNSLRSEVRVILDRVN